MIERPRAGCVALLGFLLAACGAPTGPSVTLHPTPLARGGVSLTRGLWAVVEPDTRVAAVS